MESKFKETKKSEFAVSGEFKRASDLEAETPVTFDNVPNVNKQIKSDQIKKMNRKSGLLFEQAHNRKSGVLRNTI